MATAPERRIGILSTSACWAGRKTMAGPMSGMPWWEASPELRVEWVPVVYDHERLARARDALQERLPEGIRDDGTYGLVDDVPGNHAGEGTAARALLSAGVRKLAQE